MNTQIFQQENCPIGVKTREKYDDEGPTSNMPLVENP